MRAKMQTIHSVVAEARAMGVEAEHLSSILVNLYVAIERIHVSLEREDVLAAIKGVIVNQIGSEEISIFEREGDGAPLTLTAFLGAGWPRMPAARVLREVFKTGAVYVRNVTYGDPPDTPVACVPLKVGQRVTGIIVIHSLLRHKEHLEPLDHQLCEVLANHAGNALYASALHARSKAEEVKR